MKRFTIGVCAVLLSATALPAQTPPTTPAAPAANTQKPAVPGTKIALINMRQAIVESEPGKVATAEYKKAMAEETDRLDKLSKEAQDLSEKLKVAKTDAERAELTRQLDAKTIDGQRAQQDAEKKSEDLQARLLPPIADLVNKALDAYAMENGLAVVFDPTTEPNNIIHFSMATDITNEVIRRVDAEWAKQAKPAAAPAAPATPPAPAPK